ncbi:MAG: hypothetical protein V7L01_08125 [Nostoc sp.]|uniref:ISAzo13-like element transposase-related protein n=1 Tax=Nostoc sp. TaxID=1180 RepID=UPI002FF7A6BC
MLERHTAGSPMDESVKWTNLKRHEIAGLLENEGIKVSVTVVDQLLEKHNFRKRKAVINPSNRRESTSQRAI